MVCFGDDFKMNSTEDLCNKIENDEFFKGYINDAPPVDTNSLFSYSDQINKFQQSIDLIANELKRQVREQHGALLSQALHAGRLDNSLNCMQTHMKELVEGANRLTSQINSPFAELENQTKMLRRLHEAAHLTRQAGTFLQLYKNLTNTKEFSKQAIIFNEIDSLTEDNHSLSQLKFIKDEIVSVQAAKNKLIKMADNELIQGLKTQKSDSVLNAIEILSNLGILERFFTDMVETNILDVKQSLKECFTSPDSKININSGSGGDSALNKPKGPGKTPTLTTNLNFRNKLWMALEWLFIEEISDYSQQITFLQKCLKDSTVVSADFDMEGKWWKKLEALLNDSFSNCPGHIGQCLQQGLPKLVSITKNMIQKLNVEKSVFSSKLYQSLEPGFIEKCGANLKASLVVVSDIPTEDDLNNFIRLSATEVSSAIVDDRLCEMVINVIISCNKDLWNRLESLIKLGTDARQIYDVPNGSQIQNTMIANLIHHHSAGIRQLVQNMSSKQTEKVFDGLLNSLQIGHNLELAILQQLMDAITSSVGDILISVHREPGLNTNQSSMCSLYMKELQEFLARVWSAHISPFNDREMVDECGKNLASRCIELFVRNVALLRPLTNIGRNKLKIDCQQIEIALKPLVPDLGAIGKSFRMLRAFQALLTMPIEQLAEQHFEPDNPVPTYVILMMMFSYAGNDLHSPHATANWTIEKLIQWLDGHTSDRERLELISGALLKYRNDIRKKNLSQYDPVYPIISASLEKAHALRK